MVLVKISVYFRLSFLAKYNQKAVWNDVNRKLASKDYNNIDLRKSQNLRFSKGLVHGSAGKKNMKFFLFPFLLKQTLVAL